MSKAKQTVGQNLRRRRGTMSRAAMVRLLRAEGLTVTERTIQRWEGDKTTPDAKHIEQLRRILVGAGI